jgi:hypothetical protein
MISRIPFFQDHLETPSTTIECLIEELEYLRDSIDAKGNEQLLATATKVYVEIAGMADSVERMEIIRFVLATLLGRTGSQAQICVPEEAAHLQPSYQRVG